MDSTGEFPPPREPQRTEVIGLDQDFLLFNPQTTELKKVLDSHPAGFLNKVTLRVEGLPEILFHISAGKVKKTKGGKLPPKFAPKTAFTPFDMEVGYSITKEDFNLETRAKKLKELKQIDEQRAGNSPFPLLILGFVDGSLSDQDLEKLVKLRLELNFPDLSLIGAPDARDLANEVVEFIDFYPHDTGPLPSSIVDSADRHIVSPGQRVFLPTHMGKLAQIKAKFTLLV